ncbi:MAG: hypothetical protein P4L10_00580 [Acidobacteriaceae bacterium]|nr:hypothetical protein [Acidobacteriaceae bacterium]
MQKSKLHHVRTIAVLGIASVLGLSGCARLQVKLGMKVYLSRIPNITSMEATLPQDPGISPGEKSPLVVTFKEPNGNVLVTQGKGKGKVLWSDLTVTPSVVGYKKGVLSLPWDPRVSDGKTGHVEISVPSHPELHAALDIPLRYDKPFRALYAGSSGFSGSDGNNGSDGSSGSNGSTDPDHPSAGGNGSSGTNGSAGSDGGNGSDGPAVQVVARLREGSHPLLEISVTPAGGKQRFYLVDPNGGSLTVSSNGGSGGSGGKGGRGGRGGSGGSGIPPGSSGSDGLSGSDGRSGYDGSPGAVTVSYDPSAAAYLSVIRMGNKRPAAKFVEEPVGPLW